MNNIAGSLRAMRRTPSYVKGRVRQRPVTLRGWRARAFVIVGTATVLTVGPAAAQASAAAAPGLRLPAPTGAAAVSSQPELAHDLSQTLPNLHYGQAVGDFLGEGHDQVAYADGGQLKIYEANKFGGALKKSIPTDLSATPNKGLPTEGKLTPVWQGDSGFVAGERYGLTSVKTAFSPSDPDRFVFLAGASWNHSLMDPIDTYRVRLYRISRGSDCASVTCAAHVDLPATFQRCDFCDERLVVVTSLAVGVVGGRTLIAVGLSDDGVYIFNASLQLVAHMTNMDDGKGNQTPVTALGFGPPTGPGEGGLLAVGVLSDGNVLYSYRLSPDGKDIGMTKAGGWPDIELAATVMRINGSLYTVFGRSDGTVFVLNPDTGTELAHYDDPAPQAGHEVSGLTALTPWDGSPDNQQLVIARQNGTGDQVIHYVNGALKAIPIVTGGAVSATENQLEQWYPEYGLGLLHVVNKIAGAVSVFMASRQDPKYGCWLDASLKQPPIPAFPDAATPIAAGQTSPGYLIAALTGGVQGDCSSAEGVGEWSSYVVITPAGDPADEHIVKIQVTASRTVQIKSQAGGGLTAAVERTGDAGLWGDWKLTVTGPAAAAAVTAPAVTGYRLTSKPGPDYQPPAVPVPDDPKRPVYRFDVTGATWQGIGAPGQVAAQLPPMTAQGSTDGGKQWRDLGRLMPVTAPARNGNTVTLGPASFFWQDAPGATPLTDVRVVSGGLASNVVHLDSLAAPPIHGGDGAVPVSGLKVTPAQPGGTATPLADGVDQAPLNVTLDGSGGVISNDDPRYNLVYYRDSDTHALITGLYSAGGYADYVAVGPFRGMYPNDEGAGPAAAAVRGRAPAHVRRYLVTTSTGAQSLTGVMNDSGLATGAYTNTFPVAGRSTVLGTTGTAAGGIQVTGCGTGGCPLAAPTDAVPALYQAGGDSAGPLIGLQLKAEAVTGVASLPLEVGTENAHTLTSAPLDINSGKAVLRQTSGFWPAGTIDTALVSAGDLVRALSVQVGGS